MNATHITEPVLLIRISRLYRPDMSDLELWEATRGVWRIGVSRDHVRYAFAVAGGIVREVYEVGSWKPAGTSKYVTRPASEVTVPNRWEFTGTVAPPDVRLKYMNKSVAGYFKQGSANPITYVNVK
jgi:hypothetical protein